MKGETEKEIERGEKKKRWIEIDGNLNRFRGTHYA